MNSYYIRLWTALILIELIPLILANVAGVHPSPQNHDSDNNWGHGWPLKICWRGGILYPEPYRMGWGGRYYFPDERPPRYPDSSRLPIDKAYAIWRADPGRIAFNLVACGALLMTGGIACGRSRWVLTGKPQLSLATLFVILTVVAIYLATIPKSSVIDAAVSLLPVPAIVAGILSFREMATWRRISREKSQQKC